MAEKEIKARVKAFSREGVRNNRILVANDDVLVWDSIAGHFTNVNALSDKTKRRLRKIADAEQSLLYHIP